VSRPPRSLVRANLTPHNAPDQSRRGCLNEQPAVASASGYKRQRIAWP